MKTGVVYGANTQLILIDALKYYIGDVSTKGIEKGDTVEFDNLDNMWLTHLALIQKGGTSPAQPQQQPPAEPAATTPPTKSPKKPAPAKNAPAGAAGGPAQTCKFGKCPDEKNHFVFEKRRNRWECECIGHDNPQLSKCPLEYRKDDKILTGAELDAKARAAGFGETPTDPKDQIPVIKYVSGIYVGQGKGNVMLKIDGKNAAFPADPALVKYLERPDCKAVPEMEVTLELTDKQDGKGFVATQIGPGPEKQTPPVQQQVPKETRTSPTTPAAIQGEVPIPPQDVIIPETKHGGVAVVLDLEKLNLIKAICARDCTNSEFELLLYLANKYQLDPLARQIWAVKYNNEPARIFTGRDGYLEIAHRSNMFDGMESGTKLDEEGKVIGWCRVFRKDMTRPFSVEVSLSEFDTKRNTWAKMPKVMIVKVAESQCLRKAFSITGLYSPEEFENSGGAA